MVGHTPAILSPQAEKLPHEGIVDIATLGHNGIDVRE